MLRRASAVCVLLAAVGCAERRSPGAPDGAPQPQDATVHLDADGGRPARVLLFTRTEGYRHESIPKAITALTPLLRARGFEVDGTEEAADFTDANLARYAAVVFLSTSGDVLDASEERAFERYIRAGGGYAGVHSASDTEYDWAWYGALVGAYFSDHPAIQQATVVVERRDHPATRDLVEPWRRADEWYNFRRNPRPDVTVLATVDEASYQGGTLHGDHPVSWSHAYENGRAFYTAMGHTDESWTEAAFLAHVAGGIAWAAGR